MANSQRVGHSFAKEIIQSVWKVIRTALPLIQYQRKPIFTMCYDPSEETSAPEQYEQQYKECPGCGGEGSFVDDDEDTAFVGQNGQPGRRRCPECKGTGEVEDNGEDDGLDDAAFERSRNK